MESKFKSDVDSIYREVGSVVQASQHMEYAIGFSLTLIRQLNKGVLPNEMFDASMEKFSKSTFGRLIGAIKDHVDFDESSEAALMAALKERNYIIHDFFFDQPELIQTIEGRAQLLERLQQAKEVLHNGYLVLDGITALLMKLNGLDLQDVMSEVRSGMEY